MKNIDWIKSLFIAFLCMYFTTNAYSQIQKKEILILGTLHFSNKVTDSITSQNKQDQLKKILIDLEKFDPQQIFIERPAQSDSLFFDVYINYKSGKELPDTMNWLLHNEIYQIGIKLASRLNLPLGVQGIDWRLPNMEKDHTFENDYGKYFFLYAQDVIHSYNNDHKIIGSNYTKIVDDLNEKYKKYYGIRGNITLKGAFKMLNTKEAIEELYFSDRLSLLYTDKKTGTELTEIITIRDYKSFRNALNSIQPERQRILIIYRAGHTYILNKLFDLSNNFEIRQVDEFIE